MLLLDKPLGLSSNQALQQARRLYNAEKAGHTGTLDPLATGLLIACFGEATKFSADLLDAGKRYTATVRLGVTTDTADAEGVVTSRRPVDVARLEVEQALRGFLGESLQLPPMHSALKRNGKPMYDYARQGIVVDRAPRRIMIEQINLREWAGDRCVIDVTCSKGTYVRTLAADLGERLGCGGHLAALRRTAVGLFDVASAHSLHFLETLDESERDAFLLPPDAMLADLAEVFLGSIDAGRVRHGQSIRWIGEAGAKIRVYARSPRQFLGVCHVDDGWLRPHRLISQSFSP